MFGPVLKGDNVTLRPAREGDAEHFVRWFADMEVTRPKSVLVICGV